MENHNNIIPLCRDLAACALIEFYIPRSIQIITSIKIIKNEEISRDGGVKST